VALRIGGRGTEIGFAISVSRVGVGGPHRTEVGGRADLGGTGNEPRCHPATPHHALPESVNERNGLDTDGLSDYVAWYLASGPDTGDADYSLQVD